MADLLAEEGGRPYRVSDGRRVLDSLISSVCRSPAALSPLPDPVRSHPFALLCGKKWGKAGEPPSLHSQLKGRVSRTIRPVATFLLPPPRHPAASALQTGEATTHRNQLVRRSRGAVKSPPLGTGAGEGPVARPGPASQRRSLCPPSLSPHRTTLHPSEGPPPGAARLPRPRPRPPGDTGSVGAARLPCQGVGSQVTSHRSSQRKDSRPGPGPASFIHLF